MAWQEPADPGDANVQVLTRGPIHEAFAEPVVYDPKAGPVVGKEPPKAVDEVPPDEKPEGPNVQWIPGYWSWDDGRKDYIWVSGVWRDVPPGRRWVPGYWDKVQDGFQWVPGYWAPDETEATQYLPAPPQSLEEGPNSPAPDANSTWAPGNWAWQNNQYVWQPGYWVPSQSSWVWVPSHYVWTPSGYVFVAGYWDLPLASRGQLFAPVYFQQPVYNQPNYAFTPSVGLLANSLLTSLFVRPAYGSYYFGDYYAANNFQSGIYPWYSYHQSRYGYDPLYAHYATLNARRNPRWLNDMHSQYQYLREHPEFRPAHTYAQSLAQQKRIAAYAGARPQTPVLASPINQIASAPNSPVRFERINAEGRKSITQRSAELQRFRDQRLQQEAKAGRLEGSREFRPHALNLPRSPIAGTPRDRVQSLPAAPTMPRPDRNAQPKGAGPAQAQRRFEPHPENLPPEQFRPGFRPSQEQPRPRDVPGRPREVPQKPQDVQQKPQQPQERPQQPPRGQQPQQQKPQQPPEAQQRPQERPQQPQQRPQQPPQERPQQPPQRPQQPPQERPQQPPQRPQQPPQERPQQKPQQPPQQPQQPQEKPQRPRA